MIPVAVHYPWNILVAVQEAEAALRSLYVTLLESNVHTLSLSAIEIAGGGERVRLLLLHVGLECLFRALSGDRAQSDAPDVKSVV